MSVISRIHAAGHCRYRRRQPRPHRNQVRDDLALLGCRAKSHNKSAAANPLRRSHPPSQKPSVAATTLAAANSAAANPAAANSAATGWWEACWEQPQRGARDRVLLAVLRWPGAGWSAGQDRARRGINGQPGMNHDNHGGRTGPLRRIGCSAGKSSVPERNMDRE